MSRDAERSKEFEQEPRWQIPSAWKWTTVGDVCHIVGGGTPSTSDSTNFEGGEIAWVTPADLTGYRERTISRGSRFITSKGLSESGACILPPGTVLFSSRAPIGYVAIAANELATNQGFKSFVPPQGVSSEYLHYYLQYAKPLAIELASGTTFPEISGKRAAEIPFALAPEKGQQRIAAKLDELFSDLDAGVASLRRARANLKRYRAAVLKSAVEGRLTADWRAQHPPSETGAALLARLLHERRLRWEEAQLAKFEASGKTPSQGWRSRYVEPAPPDTSQLPLLPADWCWASLEQIAADEPYSLAIGPFGSNLKVSDYSDEGVPLVFVRNIRSRSYGDRRSHFVSHAKAGELNAHSIQAGDVLITKMGEPPGDADVYPQDQPRAIITADCIKVRCWPSAMDPFLLCASINSHVGKAQIRPITKGVAQKKVSLGRFSQLAVPLPPVDEQRQVVELLSEADSYFERLDSAAELALVKASTLRQALLKRAFSGRLVPQDPTDEPASVLLERIRAARASAPAVPRKPAKRPLSSGPSSASGSGSKPRGRPRRASA